MKQRTRVFRAAVALALLLCLTGCQAAPTAVPTAAPTSAPTAPPTAAPTATPAQETAYSRFSRRAYDIFDTEITLMGYTQSQEEFERITDQVLAQLKEYNNILDAYNDYDGLHNLKYVNDHAAQAPVEVPDLFFDLLVWCRDEWEKGWRNTNIAMGAVLSIWHAYRTAGINDPQNAQLPPMEALQAASAHTDFEQVLLDAEKKTVYFADPELKLDLGAVAKGYAADLALPVLMKEMPSFLLSLGGNVYAGNAPLDGRQHWNVGVQDPRADGLQVAIGGTDILDVLEVNDLTVVTSGDYWRYYVVDGQRYHHIIDPETLMPSQKMISVSVVCESSLLADYLSTTLFILSYEEGRALVDSLPGVEVMWVEPDGTIRATDGMAQYARSLKNAP